MVDNGLPVTVNFPLHPDWQIFALIPEFHLPTITEKHWEILPLYVEFRGARVILTE